MRIRRNASKILGSVTVCAVPWPPPPPPQDAAAFADCAGILCELNSSPWDVMPMPMPMDPEHSCCCTMIFTNPKEEEDGGILGNNTRITEVEEPISVAVPSELAMSGTKIEGKERNKMYKDQKETTPASTAGAISHCRKSNGKGWHCKRLAQLPSAFCAYHLAQIRSYSSTHRHRAGADTSAAADDGEINHLTKVAAAEEKRANSNLYNFYFGLGPWRGKRRGKATVKAKVVEEVKGNKEGEMEKRMEPKKRGRKPIKARSLKSLL